MHLNVWGHSFNSHFLSECLGGLSAFLFLTSEDGARWGLSVVSGSILFSGTCFSDSRVSPSSVSTRGYSVVYLRHSIVYGPCSVSFSFSVTACTTSVCTFVTSSSVPCFFVCFSCSFAISVELRLTGEVRLRLGDEDMWVASTCGFSELTAGSVY